MNIYVLYFVHFPTRARLRTSVPPRIEEPKVSMCPAQGCATRAFGRSSRRQCEVDVVSPRAPKGWNAGTRAAAGFGAVFIEVPDLSFTRLVAMTARLAQRNAAQNKSKHASGRNWMLPSCTVESKDRIWPTKALGGGGIDDGGQ